MLIVVNSNANHGAASARWPRVAAALEASGRSFEAVETSSALEAERTVSDGLAGDYQVLAAAGGDGAVNQLLNSVMDPETDRPRAEVTIGAIGLGSSNDFHKPLAEARALGGFPARIDPTRAQPADVGKAVFTDTGGVSRTRYFILNASVGLVAAGNAYFNSSAAFLGALKKLSVGLAINYAAVRSILRCEHVSVSLGLDAQPALAVRASNISILKKVHFAGGMYYDTGVTVDDGMFDVNVIEAMGRIRLLGILTKLGRGKFAGLPGTTCHRARRVRLVPEAPTPLELDGEVIEVTTADLVVIPRVIKVCR